MCATPTIHWAHKREKQKLIEFHRAACWLPHNHPAISSEQQNYVTFFVCLLGSLLMFYCDERPCSVKAVSALALQG